MYGYQNPDESFFNSSGKFGLNRKGKLAKLELIQETNYTSVDLMIELGDSTYTRKYFQPNKVYKKGVEILAGNPEYDQLMQKEINKFSTTMCHIAESVVPREIVQQTLSQGSHSFLDFVNKIIKLVESSKTRDVDFFLQYKPSVITGKDGTQFQPLEIPGNTSNGLFIVPHQEGDYKEVRDARGLRYMDGEKIHPISRGDWFMSSNMANKIEVPSINDNQTTTTTTDNPWDY